MALAQLAPATVPGRVAVAGATARLAYIDNLRTLVVAVVVVHHAAQAYGPTGFSWPIMNPTHAAILGPFFAVNAAFGLGLLFLIAGYFVPRAYERKGARRFLAERLIRLGLPLVFVSLVLLLPVMYAVDGASRSFAAFLADYLWHPEAGHMWFVAHLIIYSFGYAVWRRLRGPAVAGAVAVPGHRAILGFTIALAIVSFLVRIWFSIDEWVDLAPFVWVEPAHLPQYLSMFIFGIMAAKGDWLRQMPARTGFTWLTVGLSAAALPYAATVAREITAADINLSVTGGLSLGALISAVIEAFIAVGLCVGLLTLFRERADHQGRLGRELAASSYAVYIIHIIPVLGLQLALAESAMHPLAKFGVVALLAVPLSFLLGYGLHKLPGVRRVV